MKSPLARIASHCVSLRPSSPLTQVYCHSPSHTPLPPSDTRNHRTRHVQCRTLATSSRDSTPDPVDVSCSDEEVTTQCSEEPPRTFYPFHCYCVKREAINDTTGRQPISIRSGRRGVERIDNPATSQRLYRFSEEDSEDQVLPSVTSVLSSTMPRSRWFSLHNWRRSMIKQHGAAEFKKISLQTMRNGSQFHKVIEHAHTQLSGQH